MGALSELIDRLWQKIKARWQSKAAAEVPEGEALQRQMDAEATEIARRAGEGGR